MGDSAVVTEEILREPEPDVVTGDGPSADELAAVTEDDTTPPADDSAATADADDDEDGDEGQDGEDDAPPRRKNSAQKRIDRLTRQRSEAERIAAEERGRRLALEELIEKGVLPKGTKLAAAGEPEPEPTPEPENLEPQPEDFDSVEDYAKAYAKWEREQETPAKPAKPAADTSVAFAPSPESQDIRTRSFEQAKAVFEDIEDRLDAVGPKLTPAILAAIEFEEDGAEILGHLADHPDELERIVSMRDQSQVSKALQRFAGKVVGSVAPSRTPAAAGQDEEEELDTPRAIRQPAARVTRAQPVGRVLSGGRVSSEPDVESMSQEEYERYMNRRDRG